MEIEEYKGYKIALEPDNDAESPREWSNLGTMCCFHRHHNLGDEHDFTDGEDLGYFLGVISPGPVPRVPGTEEYEKCTGEPFTAYEERVAIDRSGTNDYFANIVFRRDGLSAYGQLKLADTEEKRVQYRIRMTYCQYEVDRAEWERKVEIRAEYGYPKFNGVWIPLYLYDHSGLTMNTSGFSCPWDSGQIGAIYATKEDILKEYGGKKLTRTLREKAIKQLKCEVEAYDQYLRGDVYSYSIYAPPSILTPDEDDDEYDEDNPFGDADPIDSLFGLFGYEYALEEARSVIDHHITNPVQ